MKYIREKGQEFEFEILNTAACEEYHCHNGIEIIYVKSGYIRLRTDMSQMVCDVTEGDYAVIASSDVHRCFCMGISEYELIRFPVSYQNMLDGNLIRSSFVISRDVLKENSDVFDVLFHTRKLLMHENCPESVVRSLCSCLCSILLSCYGRRKQKEKSSDNEAAYMGDFSIQQSISFETIEKFDKTLTYIKENYTNTKINLESLSNVSGLNKTFLSALFPKLTGRNFKDYLNRLRVDRAIELLTTSDKNISEIAFLCGFETIRTLNNVFKSIAGVTPSAIRFGTSGNNETGIDTEIHAVGSNIFDYSWTSSVEYKDDAENNAICVFPRNKADKRWCHLHLRMLFFSGKQYSVSFKVKLLDISENERIVNCNFCFPDDVKKIEHHTPHLVSSTVLDDGWVEVMFSYTVPDYYKPSSIDNFSVYTSPYKDKAVSYLVKDIRVTAI